MCLSGYVFLVVEVDFICKFILCISQEKDHGMQRYKCDDRIIIYKLNIPSLNRYISETTPEGVYRLKQCRILVKILVSVPVLRSTLSWRFGNIHWNDFSIISYKLEYCQYLRLWNEKAPTNSESENTKCVFKGGHMFFFPI